MRMLQQEVAVVVDLLEVDISVATRLHYLRQRRLPSWPNKSVPLLVFNFLSLELLVLHLQILSELRAHPGRIRMGKVRALEIISAQAYVVVALAMVGARVWQSVLMAEAVQACVAVETFSFLLCKLPPMLVPEVKLKATNSRDGVALLADTIEIHQETLKETGEINHLKHNKNNKGRWEISKVNSNNRAISNQATVIVAQLTSP